MRALPLAFVSLSVFAACSREAKGPPAVIESNEAAAPVTPVASASASAWTIDAGSSPVNPRWSRVPPAHAELYVALDGVCRGTEIRPVDNAVFFSDGDEVQAGAGAIVNRTFGRLRPGGFDPIAIDPSIASIDKIGGSDPGALFLTTWQGQRTRPSGRLYQLKDGSHWVLRLSDEVSRSDNEHSYDLPQRWRGGFLVRESFDIEDWPDPDAGESFEGGALESSRLRGLDLPASSGFKDLEAIPPRGGNAALDFRVFPNGDLFVASEVDKKITLTTYLGSDPTPLTQVLMITDVPPYPSFEGDTRVTLRLSFANKFFTFDGAKWVPATGTDTTRPHASSNAEIHGPAGNQWKIDSGGLSHDTGSGFQAVKLPPPVFSASPESATKTMEPRGMYTAPDGEVIVVAKYDEKGIGWKRPVEQWVVYRSKRPTETLRCNEPDALETPYATGEGLQSWPPMATAACTTPFAVLTRGARDSVRAKSKKDDDHTALLKVLAAHPEFAALTLTEFHSGDRTFAGVAVPSLDIGTNVIKTVAKKIPIHGELVCGAPDAVKTFPVSAGALSPPAGR